LPSLGLLAGLLWPRVIATTSVQATALGLSLLTLSVLLVRRRRFGAAWIAIVAAAGALGALLAGPIAAPDRLGSVAQLARRYPGPAELVGRVVERPRLMPGRAVFVLAVEETRVRAVGSPSHGLVEVSVHTGDRSRRAELPYHHGDRVRVSGRLSRPRDFATPGASSRVDWLRRRGVRALLSVSGVARLQSVERAFSGPLARLRPAMAKAIARHVEIEGDPRSVRVGAVLRGLVLGDRAAIEPRDRDGLARAGLIHLLAISGLHVGIVGGLVRRALAALGVAESTSAVAGMVAAWSYVAMAGAPPSAVRAAVVGTIVMLGLALHRDGDSINSLMLAFFLCSLLEPGGVRSAGFQMTFVAAAGLLVVAPKLGAGAASGLFARALAASVGAQVAVLPVVVTHFGRACWGGLALNMVGVPLAAIGLTSGIALVGLDAIDPRAAALVGHLARVAIDLLVAIGESEVVMWSMRVPSDRDRRALLYGVTLTLALAMRGLPRSPRVAAVALVASWLVWPIAPESPPAGSLRLHLLDVGQGDAILVERGDGTAWLVDAGGFPGSSFDVGDRVVVPYLLGRGRRHVDVAVVTHAHPDHAGGMAAVVRDLNVAELWLPSAAEGALIGRLVALAERRGTRVVRVDRRHRAGDVRVLHPQQSTSVTGVDVNDASIVLTFGPAPASVLLTGDIYVGSERRLRPLLTTLPVAVLKVAHHGSRTSSGPGFIAAVQPRLALISCGYRNRFGHPHPIVVERLRSAGAAIRRTDLDGTVLVRIGSHGRIGLAAERVRFLNVR